MRSRLGVCAKTLLALAGPLVLLPGTAAVWWFFPPRPRASWETGPCNSVYVAPGGRTVITEHETEIALWNLETGTKRGTLDRALVRGQLTADRQRSAPGDPPAPALWQTPDGNGVLYRETKGDTAGLVLWPGVGHAARLLPGAVGVAAFTPDGRAVIARTEEGLMVVALATGREIPGPPRRARAIHAQAVSGGTVLSVEADGPTLTIRDLATGIASGSISAPPEPFQLTLSGDGRVLAVAAVDSVQVWELPAGKRRCTVEYAPQSWVRALAELNADGGRLLLRTRSTRLDPAPVLAVWDVTTHPARLLSQLPTSAAAARTATFSPDGRWLVQQDLWIGDDRPLGGAAVWDAAALRPHLTLSRGGWCGTACFRPQGGTVAAHWSTENVPSHRWLEQVLPAAFRPTPTNTLYDNVHCVRVWDLTRGEELAMVPHASVFAYLPDGSGLVTWRAAPPVSAPDDAIGGVVEVWDQPLRRPRWVDYGLPALFALIGLAWVRPIRSACCRPASPLSRPTMPTSPPT